MLPAMKLVLKWLLSAAALLAVAHLYGGADTMPEGNGLKFNVGERNTAFVLDYLRTWSSTQRFLKETGVDPCLALRERLRGLWPEPGARKTIVWPVILRCGRIE